MQSSTFNHTIPSPADGIPERANDRLVSLRQAVAELLAVSDERDLWSERMLQAWRDGWRACDIAHADDYGQGYADGIAGRKRRQHQAVAALRIYRSRWELRGEVRTRRTFGQPHPADFQGRGAAA